MQTFLPYPNFLTSAKCLDYRRLGKERVEAKQILNILLNRTTSKGWCNHPAVTMWAGYENALKHYFNIMVGEWIKRGYKNTMQFEEIESAIIYPPWLGNESFHASHRSNLLRKDFAFYSQYGWKESADLPYVWPIKED